MEIMKKDYMDWLYWYFLDNEDEVVANYGSADTKEMYQEYLAGL